MIRIVPRTPTADQSANRVYENLRSVGAVRTGENTNADKASNQLVQFFLRAFFKRNPGLLPTLPKKSGFLLDGRVGLQTIEGINRFQIAVRQSGFPLVTPDQRVSVASGNFVPGTQSRWTIHALNSFYAFKSGETDFNTLFANQAILNEAPELAAELLEKEPLPNTRK